jgi:hypothetical protein
VIDTLAAGSPGWWFDRLARQLVARKNRLDSLADYLEGNAPLPEGADGLRQAYQSFQRKARTNFAELVVEAVQERMTVSGFRVGNEAAEQSANRIWSLNEMATTATDVHGDMLGLSVGYCIVGPNGTEPIITYEDPQCVITDHDPLRPSRVRAALKLYRDDEAGKEFAFVYLPGVVYKAERDCSSDPTNTAAITQDISGFDWSEDGVTKLPAPIVPVVRFANRKLLGEFETHTDVIDRINYTVLQRLVVTAMQAFRQRAILGDLPEKDEAGNKVDYNAIFRPGAGALWFTQANPDLVKIWESQQTDLSPLLAAAKDDIRDLAAVTRTPMSMLIPDAQNQSAEGAAAAREGLVYKAKDRIQRATYGWNTVMRIALAFAGLGDLNVETEWLDPERRSLAERADAASKLAPSIPKRTLWTDILQFPPDKADRMEAEAMEDALNASLAMPLEVTPNGAGT